MDAEKLANFKNSVANLSDSSPNQDFKNIAIKLGELYKEELPETLAGGALTTERGNVDTDVTNLVNEFDARTDQVKK